jgi:hypothetical protein
MYYTNLPEFETPEIYGLKFYPLTMWNNGYYFWYVHHKSLRPIKLPKHIINLAKNKKKFYIFLNDTLEGYAYLNFKFVHEFVSENNLEGKVIYATGHQFAMDEYDAWCSHKGLTKTFYVYPQNNFLYRIQQQINDSEWKEFNSNKSTWFLCLNHRSHPHRQDTVEYLINTGLIENGIVSAHWDTSKGRLIADYDLNGNSAAHNFEMMLYNTPIINLVTETFYSNRWNFCSEMFITEKTYKAIAAKQMFIIVGPKGILRRLQSFGFKTFSNFIDESYDNEPDETRLYSAIDQITHLLTRYNATTVSEMTKEIREYNYNLLKTMGGTDSPIWQFVDELIC